MELVASRQLYGYIQIYVSFIRSVIAAQAEKRKQQKKENADDNNADKHVQSCYKCGQICNIFLTKDGNAMSHSAAGSALTLELASTGLAEGRTSFSLIRKSIVTLVSTCYQFGLTLNVVVAIFSTSQPHPFHSQHQQCGTITIIPVKGVAHIQVRCTECTYTYKYTTKRKPKYIDTELKDAMHSMQKGLHRKRLSHKGGCYRPNCQCCRMLIRDNHVTSPTGTKYTLPSFNCNSKNCIYVIRCTKCKIQYVGLTTTNLRLRINNHKTTIHKDKPSPVALHFNKDDHNINHLELAILEHCPTASLQTLRTKEAMWIHLLDTLNNGLNAKDETNIVLDPHTINITHHFQHSITCTPYTTSWIEEVSQLNP